MNSLESLVRLQQLGLPKRCESGAIRGLKNLLEIFATSLIQCADISRHSDSSYSRHYSYRFPSPRIAPLSNLIVIEVTLRGL
jgi:hypothetical protein